ncbi:MAG: hypothetical protein EXS35_06655 [Pedosphaera sp.]|nr:hypothetical protein [Pedosphaera sp.]
MDWIKRNLFFVVGAAVALLLIVGAGFYTWTGYNHNATESENLKAKYAELKRLYESKDSPGDGKKVDNITEAKKQLGQIRDVMKTAGNRFQPIPPIVVDGVALTGGGVTVQALSRGMSQTIARLQTEATNASVQLLQPKYNFSFEQQSGKLKFDPRGLGPLAAQLAEVKVLTEVLIAAKVNSLEAIQRERVAAEDYAGATTDYLELKSRTNELAVTTPYQITFRSFTPELAQVLCGYASSPYGIVVKHVNVEPVTATPPTSDPGAAPVAYAPVAYAPVAAPPRFAADKGGGLNRYGKGGLAGTSPNYPPPVAAPVAMAAAPSGPKSVLNEKQLRITLLVELVKMNR